MLATEPAARAGSIVAIVGVLGLALAVVRVGSEPPPPPTPAASPVATFEPNKIVVSTTRHWPPPWPFREEWSAEETVRIRSTAPLVTGSNVEGSYGYLVSGSGGQLRADLADPIVRPSQSVITARLRIADISPGEYAGTVSLGPPAEKPPALEVTLKARDGFLWPWIVLVVGMFVGLGGTWAYDSWRRRRVLQSAVVDAAAWLQFVPCPKGVYDIQSGLVGDDVNKNLFPRGIACRGQTLGVPKLYCKIARSWTGEALDGRTEEVQALLARTDRWYRAGAALHAMNAASGLILPERELAGIRNETSALAQSVATEPADDEAELTISRIKAQAQVLSIFAEAWRLFLKAGSPSASSPAALYAGVPAATERSPEDSRKLIGRLRSLAIALQQATAPPIELGTTLFLFGAPGESLATNLTTPAAAEPEVAEPPWTVDEGGFQLSSRIRRRLRVFDVLIFGSHVLVATAAFLLPIWLASSFGSLDQYIAVFAAGFLGKVALDEAIAPVRSVRLAPIAPVATPAENAQK